MVKFSQPKSVGARVAAAQVIAMVLKGQSLSVLLPKYSDLVEQKDRAQFKEMCFGSLRWYPQIAILIKQLIHKPLRNKDLDIQGLIVCGIYQLLYMRISEHAIINETVAACKSLKKDWAKGLINAVLRKVQRDRESLLHQNATNPIYSSAHPQWLLEKFSAAWPQNVDAIVNANNQRAPMTLRVNSQNLSRDDYLDKLASEKISAHKTHHSSDGIQLDSAMDVTLLPHFQTGAVSVQDEAAQLAAELLRLEPNQRVLDACCAPGGKTCHILETQPNLETLIAIDSESSRLAKVRDNLTRIGLDAELKAADASELDNWWDGKPFDRILVDAPCSGTGVIRRHPDIKLLRKPTDIAKLVQMQTRLLQQLWKTLSNQGILVYATCSILPEENDGSVKAFVDGRDDVELMHISEAWGHATDYGRQLLPVPEGNDGFYYARLRKQGDVISRAN